MADDSAPNCVLTMAFKEINKLYDNDELETCITKARELLRDPTITRYYRMRALVVLASTLGDWSEANACYEEAETLWQVHRRWHPEGEDIESDAAMAALREFLDEIKQVLQDELFENYQDDSAIKAQLPAYAAIEVGGQLFFADAPPAGAIPRPEASEEDGEVRSPCH
jgi:hypothetical protein